jgi:hypothetical protein
MFTFKNNEVTGLPQANFNAKLISIANQSRTNSNGKEYFVATISFVDNDAVEQNVSAIIYKGNFDKGMSIGNEYRSTVTIMPDEQPLITVSHLTGAARATADMFGYAAESILAK